MGRYETRYWASDSWEAPSGVYHPYVPDRLSGTAIPLEAATAAVVAKAEGDIRALNAGVSYLTDTEPLARIIMRSEAMASSRIEGLEVPARRLLECEALDELGVPRKPDTTEAAVVSNISAMREGIEGLASGDALDMGFLLGVNQALLERTRMAAYGGVMRSEQNWIGGNDLNPVGAAYVPPRPQLVSAYLDDLVEFCNTSRLPSLAVAALAHAQLETIHPFADGNGRTGRALVHAVLRMRGLAPLVVPPISLVLATDKRRYIDQLSAYRVDAEKDGERPFAEAANGWIEYFAIATSISCERASQFEKRLSRIQEEWRRRLRPREKSAADILLKKLPGNPVVSVASVARLTGRSREASRLAIASLVKSGILVQSSKNRRSGLYSAREVLDAFTSYERALSVPSGDTSLEKPARPVPQRPVPRRP